MTSLKRSHILTTLTFLLWCVNRTFNCSDTSDGIKNIHTNLRNKYQNVDKGLICVGQKNCKNTPLCGSNFVTYANFTLFNKARIAQPKIKVLHQGKCKRGITTLDDIYIAVKTSKKFEKTRLTVILNTWFLLAKQQTWFFTDRVDTRHALNLSKYTNDHIINTNCLENHSIKALCCKTAVEFEYYIKSGKRWLCHFDDDNYVNVPRLLMMLKRFDPDRDWYFGRKTSPTVQCTRVFSSQAWAKYFITFATLGAGTCFSRSLVNKMIPHITNGQLVQLCSKLNCPDDVAIGYVAGHLARAHLTEVSEFHSHYERLKKIPKEIIDQQISFSYKGQNVMNVARFDADVDPTRFYSMHCYLFPKFSMCRNLSRTAGRDIATNQLLFKLFP